VAFSRDNRNPAPTLAAMHFTGINVCARHLAILLMLFATSCAFLEPAESSNPLIGTWSTPDQDRVTFSANAVVLSPSKGQPTTLGPTDCNGVYKLQYGRMMTAALEQSFPSQPDLQSKLKQFLTKPDYPVVDVTCDKGGMTYLMLDEHRMLAVYRDSGVGGTEAYSRL